MTTFLRDPLVEYSLARRCVKKFPDNKREITLNILILSFCIVIIMFDILCKKWKST